MRDNDFCQQYRCSRFFGTAEDCDVATLRCFGHAFHSTSGRIRQKSSRFYRSITRRSAHSYKTGLFWDLVDSHLKNDQYCGQHFDFCRWILYYATTNGTHVWRKIWFNCLLIVFKFDVSLNVYLFYLKTKTSFFNC